MTKYVLRRVETNLFLSEYDPDFVPPPPHPRYPSGMVVFTADPAQAMHFESAFDALQAILVQSVTVPWRPDGLPNRPISGFHFWVDPYDP